MTQQNSAPPAHDRPRIDVRDIHPDALKVLRRLAGAGFHAYLVGGCVRDLLLNLHPKDFDIATNARPRQVKRVFRNSRIIGRRFRLVHVHFGPRVIEVSTFRAPPEPSEDDPYIRQDNVFGTEEQDAFRRDFTINGLFYDLAKARVIDHVGGLPDLAARRIRVIGDPDVRLREDPVRILRAAKFAGRLGFELTPELREAVKRHCGDLAKSALPRILEELYRLLAGRGGADAFRLLEELGALDVLLPEITPLPEYFARAVRALEERSGGDRNALPQSLLIAVLVSPAVLPGLIESPPVDYESLAGELMRPVVQRLTVARRDATIARQCLAAQVRLLEEPHGRSARRFVRREHFPESLELRAILGPATAVVPDPLAEWESLYRDARDTGPRRGRKRRRRRRRRGRGLSGNAPAGTPEA